MNNIDILIHETYIDLLNNSNISKEERIHELYLLESFNGSYTIRTIRNIIQFIKNLIVPFIKNNIVLPIERRIKLRSIYSKYNNLIKDYERIKNEEEPSVEDKRVLLNKVVAIKQEIDEFKLSDSSSYPVEPGSEDSSDESSEEIKGEGSVGYVTNMIDQSATTEWRKYWKERCGRFNGIELNRCKARGVDKALIDIQSKMKYCNNTVDPIGCKNTVMRMIDEWKKRKINYTTKR